MNERPRILFVDDEANVLNALRRSLRDLRERWDLHFLTDPERALVAIRASDFDTIVTDVRMPGMDGLELIRCIREIPGYEDVPIVVLTGNSEADLKRRALDMGAVDLLNKPVATEDLIARVSSALRIRQQQEQLREYSAELERQVAQRTQELADSRLDILWRLGNAAEYRDEDTGYHVVRVGLYARCLGEALGLDRRLTENLFMVSPLHDVGKIGIPDSILLKPGRLDPEEMATMRRHCEIGGSILCGESVGMKVCFKIEGRNLPFGGLRNALLVSAARVALSHHEKWDGSGYPRGQRGQDIPLEGRIVALADVFDALSSERPYKPAYPEEKVLSIIRENNGTHFDPAVVDAFERQLDTFRAIRAEYSDPAGIGRRLVG